MRQKTDEVIEHAFTEHKKVAPKTLDSIFYMRCEETPAQLLIGNMQIDFRKEEYKGAAPYFPKSLGRPSNIFKLMVQEAIKWGLTKDNKKIIFHAGYANYISQWGHPGEDFKGVELITEKTLPEHQKNHADWQEQVAALNPGGSNLSPRSPGIVFSWTAAS